MIVIRSDELPGDVDCDQPASTAATARGPSSRWKIRRACCSTCNHASC
ncbi:hypothetical protein [Massilia phosphatilytica]